MKSYEENEKKLFKLDLWKSVQTELNEVEKLEEIKGKMTQTKLYTRITE